jgi:hypothetical protein
MGHAGEACRSLIGSKLRPGRKAATCRCEGDIGKRQVLAVRNGPYFDVLMNVEPTFFRKRHNAPATSSTYMEVPNRHESSNAATSAALFFLPLPGRAFSFAAPSLCSWHTLVRKPSMLRQGSLGIKIHPCNDVTLLMYLVDFKVRRSFGGLPATAQLFLKDHEEVRRPVVYRVIRNRKARGAVAL